MVRAAWGAAAVATIAAVAMAVYVATRPGRDVSTTRFTFTPPTGQQLTLTANLTLAPTAFPVPLAVSPDGTKVAFLANGQGSRSQIWVRPLDALSAQVLPGTEGASGPFWSPDSRFIAFYAGGLLRKIDVNGGPPTTLTKAAGYRGGSWGDGVIVFGTGNTGPLLKVSDAGGDATPVTVQADGEGGHIRPTFLPDGRRFLYRVLNGGIYLASIDLIERRLVLEDPDTTNVAYIDGHLLFMRETTLMAQPFDERAATVTGEAIPIAENVYTGGNPPTGVFSISRNGTLTYLSGDGALAQRRLTWIDRGGKRTGTLEDADGNVQISPDGSKTAFTRGAGEQQDIWIFDNARGVAQRFTTQDGAEVSPAWSPDGKQIAFGARRGNAKANDLYVKPADGVGAEQLVYADDRNKMPMGWTPDGSAILYMTSGGPTGADLMVLPLTGERKPFPYLATPFNEGPAKLSPNGQWVVFLSNESRSNNAYIAPFPTHTDKRRVSTGGTVVPRWSRDGRFVMYGAQPAKIMAVEVSLTGLAPTIGAARELFDVTGVGVTGYTWDEMPDGKRFLVNLLPDQTLVSEITVVLNWTNLLRK